MAKKILELKHISKEFPGVKVLQDIGMELYEGEVLGLCGENGAGKSTLIKILSGLYQPENGSIEFEGKEVKLNAEIAMGLGISAIYQELTIVPEMTVAENLFLGRVPKTALGLQDPKAMERESRKILRLLDLDVEPMGTKAGDLSLGVQQLIEIGKAIGREAKVLIMDEPTSSLGKKDTEHLYSIIRRFREKGYGIIFISHHMEEIFEITDRVAVLRDGNLIDTRKTSQWNVDELVFAMVNRKISQQFPKKHPSRRTGESVLKLTNVSSSKVHDINMDISAGEIVGIAGIVGAGRTELLKTIFGFYKITAGEVRIHGKKKHVKSIRSAWDEGIVLVPEDRKKEGLVLEQSIQDNIVISHFKKLSHLYIVNNRKIREVSLAGVNKYKIRTPSLDQIVGKLSGGNQQKVILSRVTVDNPKILLLDEPTRGIDVSVKMEMYQEMIRLAEAGTAIVMVSSELPEVLGMADRILVMREGRIVAALSKEEATSELVMHYATGGR